MYPDDDARRPSGIGVTTNNFSIGRSTRKAQTSGRNEGVGFRDVSASILSKRLAWRNPTGASVYRGS